VTTLQDCIQWVESGNHAEAMRFEPTLFTSRPAWVVNQIAKIQYAHGGATSCDTNTAMQIACTSYGLYQILGANIYASGDFKNSIFDFVFDLLFQEDAFQRFIAPHGFTPDEDLSTWNDERFAAFATFYNGPGNVASYVKAMRAHA
jgi:hypothetical protein